MEKKTKVHKNLNDGNSRELMKSEKVFLVIYFVMFALDGLFINTIHGSLS